MPILTCGINHQSAPIEIREQFSIVPEQTPLALKELLQYPAINEAVIVSTCNRIEIISAAEDFQVLQQWLLKKPNLNKIDLTPFCYYYQGLDAVRHLMRVTSGLDSMIIGEPQIFGQVKQAYAIARDTGSVGRQLTHLFPAVFAVSKQIRQKTAINNSPISIAYAALQLAKRIFSNLKNCTVLLIGAGATIELVATHLLEYRCKKLIIANRNFDKAKKLANEFQGHAIQMTDIATYLKESDVVITATSSPLPILGKGTVESMIKQERRRPIFMADLAVPRDIEPEVGELPDIYLYNIDDLQQVIAANLSNRHEAAKQAESIIEIQALHYMHQLRILDAKDMICGYRRQLEHLRDQELAKALDKLQRGHNPNVVLTELAKNLVNKIMHQPTIKIREAAYNEQIETLLLAKDLFEL